MTSDRDVALRANADQKIAQCRTEIAKLIAFYGRERGKGVDDTLVVTAAAKTLLDLLSPPESAIVLAVAVLMLADRDTAAMGVQL